MSTPLLNECLRWFHAHADSYLAISPEQVRFLVQRKTTHTLRVLAHTRGILKTSHVPAHLHEPAEIAAVLHDVGRYPQLVHKATFDDHTGLNHAEEGARILAPLPLLDPLGDRMKQTVVTAVQYHNVGVLPEGLEPDAVALLQILRDADKLDAIRNNLRYMDPKAPHGKALKSGLVWHPTEVSSEAVDNTLARGLVPFTSIRWSNDFILFLCCWVYDLHHVYAYRRLKNSGNYARLLAMLPDGAPFDRVKAHLTDDLNRYVTKPPALP